MMNSMRIFAKSFGAKLLLLLLIACFAVWGVEDMLRSTGSTHRVASVGKKEISFTLFRNEYQREEERARLALKDKYSPELLRTLGLPRQVLQRIITDEMLLQEAQSLGLNISDAQAAADIRAEKVFQNAEGKFDPALFHATLQRANYNEQTYVQTLKTNHSVSLLLEGLNTGNATNDNMLDTLLHARAEERSATLAVLSAADMKVDELDRASLEAYFRDNAVQFMAPELRKVSYVRVNAAELAKNLPVPEAELKKQYEERAALFGGKAETYEKVRASLEKEWRASHAGEVITTLSSRLEDALGGGSTLEEAAKELKLDYQTFGPAAEDDKNWPKDENFVQNAFRLQEGDDSRLVKGNSGNYYLLRVEAITPAQPKPFAEVEAQVRSAAKQSAQMAALQQAGAELAKKMKDGSEPLKAAEAAGAKIVQTGALRRDSVKTSSNLLLPGALVAELFTLPAGGVTQPHAGSGSVMVAVAGAPSQSKSETNALLKDPKLKAYADNLPAARRQEIMEAYLNYLRGKYHVSVNEEALASFNQPSEP